MHMEQANHQIEVSNQSEGRDKGKDKAQTKTNDGPSNKHKEIRYERDVPATKISARAISIAAFLP